MWELDYKESWARNNWFFLTVVFEKTLESPFDCKEIQPVHPKGNQYWIFIGRTDAEVEIPILWPPDAKNGLVGKARYGERLMVEEKRTAENEMVRRHHQLNGHEFELTVGVRDGQGGLVCCSPWVPKSRTWLSDWTQLNWSPIQKPQISYLPA